MEDTEKKICTEKGTVPVNTLKNNISNAHDYSLYGYIGSGRINFTPEKNKIYVLAQETVKLLQSGKTKIKIKVIFWTYMMKRQHIQIVYMAEARPTL